MNIQRLCVLLLLAAAIGATAPSESPTPAAQPSALQLYRQALAAMSDLNEPAYVTYDLISKSDGLKAELDDSCLPCLFVGHDGGDRWRVEHRTVDYENRIIDEADGQPYLSDVANFDPTWYGTYRALRVGMWRRINLYSVPRLPPSPSAAPLATKQLAATSLKTIAAVEVLGPGIYNVESRGAASCPNGEPGYALHLWSHAHNPRHQLSDVIIDLNSKRFCMARMVLNAPGPMGGNGTWEVHFGDVAGYWMVTDGVITATSRAFGIAMSNGAWIFHLTNMQFPQSLPPATFDHTEPVTSQKTQH